MRGLVAKEASANDCTKNFEAQSEVPEGVSPRSACPTRTLIELDERDECPIEIVRAHVQPRQVGHPVLFIPEEFGGMGGGAFDVYCVCEEMARIDWESRPLCWLLSSAAIRSPSAPRRSRRRSG